MLICKKTKQQESWAVLLYMSSVYPPFPTFNKSAAGDFENIPEKNWKLPLNESIIIEQS